MAAGTVVWSLVPYGSGWVTNRKEVDLKQNDGAAFRLRFCQFCLRELSGEAATPPPQRRQARPWAHAGRRRRTYRSLERGRHRRQLPADRRRQEGDSRTGRQRGHQERHRHAARAAGEADPKTLTGELKVVFHADPTRTFTVKAAVTIEQGGNSLAMVFENWPIFAHNGKFKHMGTQRDTWNRADSS